MILVAAGLGALGGWFAGSMSAVPEDPGPGLDAATRRADGLERENRELRERLEYERTQRRAEPPRAAAPETGPGSPGTDALVQGLGGSDAVRSQPAPAMFVRTKRGTFEPQSLPSGTTDELIAKLRDALAAGDTAAADLLQVALQQKGAAAAGALLQVLRDPGAPQSLVLRALSILGTQRVAGLASAVSDLVARTDLPAPARAAALGSAVRGDPEASVPVVQRLLWSGVAGDLDLAHQALSSASDAAFAPLLRQETNRPDRSPHIHGMLMALAGIKDRAWSAHQMTGEPDTPIDGDLGTAWAAKQPKMGRVWVEVDYADAVVPDVVRIRETLNPGAVVRIEAKRPGGALDLLWQGDAAAAPSPRWFEPPLDRAPAAVRTLRITLDTDRIDGWNEIDAVELIGNGLRQWATGARASSSYAD